MWNYTTFPLSSPSAAWECVPRSAAWHPNPVVPKLCLGMRWREALLRNLNPRRNLRSSPSAANSHAGRGLHPRPERSTPARAWNRIPPEKKTSSFRNFHPARADPQTSPQTPTARNENIRNPPDIGNRLRRQPTPPLTLSSHRVVPKLCLGMRPCEALLRNLNPCRNLRSPKRPQKPCRSQAPLGNASRQAPLGKPKSPLKKNSPQFQKNNQIKIQSPLNIPPTQNHTPQSK